MTFQVPKEKGLQLRKTHLDKANRVVVKVGSAVLTSSDGLNYDFLDNLAEELVFLRKSGKEVLLVSSGAVAAGKKKLNLSASDISLKEKQAAAA